MKKALVLLVSLLFISFNLKAQIDLGYQKPAKEILDLVDVPLPPTVKLNEAATDMLLLYRNQFKTIAELSETELRLAGLRINPNTNIGSRTRYYNKIELQKVGEKKPKSIKGLPEAYRIANLSWSPDESKVAFTNTTEKGVELWVVDIKTATGKKLTEDRLNANIGRPFQWLPDGRGFLVKFLPKDRKPLIDKTTAIPTGPRISVNKSGTKAQNRTYQDLLSDKADEANFEQLVRSEIHLVDIDGQRSPWKETAMYRGFNFSPDGNFVMLDVI